MGCGCCGCGYNAPDIVASSMGASGKSENDEGIVVGAVRSALGAGKRSGELGRQRDLDDRAEG